MDDLEERRRHVQLVATKGNALPPSAFVPLWLRRDDSGALSDADLVFDSVALSRRDMDVLGALSGLGGTAPLATWRDRCVEAGLVSGTTEDAQGQVYDPDEEQARKSWFNHKGDRPRSVEIDPGK